MSRDTVGLTHDGVVCSIDASYYRESLPTIKSSVDTVREGTITRVRCWRVPGHKYGVLQHDIETNTCWW